MQFIGNVVIDVKNELWSRLQKLGRNSRLRNDRIENLAYGVHDVWTNVLQSSSHSLVIRQRNKPPLAKFHGQFRVVAFRPPFSDPHLALALRTARTVFRGRQQSHLG